MALSFVRVIIQLWVVGCCCRSAHGESGANRWEALKFVSGFFGLDGERLRPDNGKKLTLIGAGFSRTGTKSMEAALMQLGHKIYDTRSMTERGHADRWVQAAQDYSSSKNVTLLEELLTEIESLGYTATLDTPMNLFAPAFADLRPSAKVLMTVRESSEKWIASLRATRWILACLWCRPWSWFVNLDFVGRIMFSIGGFPMDPESMKDDLWRPVPWFDIPQSLPAFDKPGAKAKWIEWQDRFRGALESKLSKERLLIFDLRSGWAPLLTFLGIEDAELAASPFPNINDRSSLQTVRKVMDIIGAGLPFWILLLCAVVFVTLRGIYRCLCRRSPPMVKEKAS